MNLSTGDWALLFGVLIAVGQSFVQGRKLRRHRRRVDDWSTEAGEQMGRIVKALRLCRASERRLRRRVAELEARLNRVGDFHGPGKCYPLEWWERPLNPDGDTR